MHGKWVRRLWGLIFVLLFLANHSLAQGCSDAGVCTLGDLSSGDHYGSTRHLITISDNIGISDTKGELVLIFASSIEGRFQIFPKTFVAVKTSHQVATGKLATTTGFGNFVISATQTILSKPEKKLDIIVGGMIPPNRSNFTEGGRGLPMEYQSSLGSYEIMAGASFSLNRWKFALGYQHPFNRNSNSFLRTSWPGDDNAANYFESNRLKRGDDLSLRIERAWQLKKSDIFLSLLPIWRIQKDEIMVAGQPTPLSGSNQVTININFTYQRLLSDKIIFRFVFGNPLLFRETRADGLTRIAVTNVSFSYQL